MAEITVANKDSTIVNAVKTALANATIDSVTVFTDVVVTCSEPSSRQRDFTDSPIAVIWYQQTDEYEISDVRRGQVINMTLILAAHADGESARLTEITRLKNAAMNAVNGTPPADSAGFAVDDELYRCIDWGEPEIDTISNQPWAVCFLPLQVAYVVTDKNSH